MIYIINVLFYHFDIFGKYMTKIFLALLNLEYNFSTHIDTIFCSNYTLEAPIIFMIHRYIIYSENIDR